MFTSPQSERIVKKNGNREWTRWMGLSEEVDDQLKEKEDPPQKQMAS